MRSKRDQFSISRLLFFNMTFSERCNEKKRSKFLIFCFVFLKPIEMRAAAGIGRRGTHRTMTTACRLPRLLPLLAPPAHAASAPPLRGSRRRQL